MRADKAGCNGRSQVQRAPIPARDISFTTASTLSRLEQRPRRLTSLAADGGVAQPSMTQLVQRLERQGLAERDRDPDDGRVVWVGITEAGRALLADRRTRRAQELADLLATLPPEEAAPAGAVLAALPVIRGLH
jgi:DNA-binding MarR family transcriptional regulator